MNDEEFLYLMPYLFSLVLSVAVFVYAWQHRLIRGAKIYSLYVAGQTLTILAFILELISPSIQVKILWDKFQWLTVSYLILLPLLIFSIEFSEVQLRYPHLVWGAVTAMLGGFTLFLLIDGVHHLLYPDPHLIADQPFPELQYTFTTPVRVYLLVYLFGVTAYSLSLLIRRAVQPDHPNRSQFWIVIAGISIPLIFSFLTFIGINITPQRDNSPFALALGNLIVAWGLFRYRLFELAPVARDQIVENMSDPVIVFDPQNRVVDINHAALKLMGKQRAEAIGHASTELFVDWLSVLELLDSPHAQPKDVTVQGKDSTQHFDINLSPILNRQGGLVGRILVVRDVSELKNLEINYRSLFNKLEQRVKERTEELRASAERYRAVVENQREFIVRWRPDRRRTFVNDAYCRYFGFTPAQAMQTDFLTLIAEEDRPSVEEKIKRLAAGLSDVETEVHRVIRADGSRGWNEWTDHVIRNDAGEVVEFQSIGRDITERKQAERALQESEAIYRKAIEVAGAVPYQWSYKDGNECFVFIGEGVHDLTGYTREEFNANIWSSLAEEKHLLGDLAQYSWDEAIERVRKGLNPTWQCEYRIRHRNGEARWVSEVAVELWSPDGQPYGSIGLFQDITERKQAEIALQKSEKKHRLLFESANDSILILKDGIVIDCNSRTLEMLGCERESVLGKSPIDFSPISQPDGSNSSQKARDKIKAVLSEGSQFFEWQHVRCDGTLFDAEVSLSLLELDNGILIQSIVRDITERKRAEETLRESEALYHQAIEVAGAVPYRQTYTQESGPVFDFIGEGIYEITGYGPEELNSILWKSISLEANLLGELAKYPWQEAVERVRSGASPIWQCEHRIRHRDGGIRWIYEAAVELRDKSGRSHGSIGLLEDITERKQAEQSLRASEERFSKAFHASPVMITISRLSDATLLEVNQTFEEVTGYAREEAVGKSTLDLELWANLADRERIIASLSTHGEVRNEEVKYRIKDGSIITCLLAADLIELGSERCVLAAIQDISARKMAEARILRLNRLYATISQINQAIVHARDKESLFREICQVAIDHGQFRMAWIGVLDEEDSFIKPVVFAGEEQGYLAHLNLRYGTDARGRGPSGTSIREGRCVICQDIASDPSMALWREDALSRGFRSCASVPLREHGRVIAALAVYAGEVNGFDAEDKALLDQIGQDVSFALDSIDAENKRLKAEKNLAEAYDTTLKGWAMALELRDKETEGHSRRVTEATAIVAGAMGFEEEALVHIRRGSILHDIGKMGISDEILRKNGALTAEERTIVEKHPQTAYELLHSISYLEKALEIPYCHHERWDGTGYPRRLRGEEIPLPARIFAIVDVWDALSSDRSYRAAWPREKVIEYLIQESGKHFDPKVLNIFLQLLREGKI